MIRIDRARLEHATFPEHREVQTRIDDMDVQGHINNVAVAVFLQEARGAFNKGHIGAFLGNGGGLVVGGMFIEYAGQMFYPDPVAIAVGVLEIGRSSFVLGMLARQKGRITVFAESTLIATYNGAATPLSPEIRASLEEAMIRG